MTDEDRLPALDECTELYLTAFEEFGTERFDADEITSEAATDDVERVLDLAVAYGLLDQMGEAYEIAVEPDAPQRRWTATIISRMDRIRNSIESAWNSSGGVTQQGLDVVQDETTFASVFLPEGEGEAYLRRAMDETVSGETDGFVLRTPATNASTLQRLADRLCSGEQRDQPTEYGRFEKESTDVIGSGKDSLEFRIYLVAT